MSILCQSCCGDGLHHTNPDVFEISVDDPCPECQGLGVSEEAGDPVDMIKYLASPKRKHYESTELDFYMGEGLDKFQKLPVRYRATYLPAEHGAREAGSGIQLEPDHPASYEVEDFHVEVNGEWYYFEPNDKQIEQATKHARGDD